MENPFLTIDARLENLESLLLDIKHKMISSLLSNLQEEKQQIVDLDGLLKARPFVGSKSTIYKKVSRGEIPHSKRGKRLIFDLKTIDHWLLSNKIKTADEIQAETMAFISANAEKKRMKKGGPKTSF